MIDYNKIQLKLTDSTYILTSIDNVKLIKAENAKDNSLFNYTVSLVCDETKVTIYGEKQKIKKQNHSLTMVLIFAFISS